MTGKKIVDRTVGFGSITVTDAESLPVTCVASGVVPVAVTVSSSGPGKSLLCTVYANCLVAVAPGASNGTIGGDWVAQIVASPVPAVFSKTMEFVCAANVGGGEAELVRKVDVELAACNQARQRIPVFADRRPELYGLG